MVKTLLIFNFSIEFSDRNFYIKYPDFKYWVKESEHYAAHIKNPSGPDSALGPLVCFLWKKMEIGKKYLE